MNVLVLTTQVLGAGGIQYAGRLFLDALRDSAGPSPQLTVVSILDPKGSVAINTDFPFVLEGAEGSRVLTVRNWIREWRRGKWDLVVLGHLNLAPLLLLAKGLRRVPVIGWIYGIEAWKPLSPLRRRGLGRADKLLYISEHSRLRAFESNAWLQEIPGEVCHLSLRPDSELGPVPSLDEGKAVSPYALAVGRMSSGERYKGHEELIRVWPEVSRVRPDLRLVIVGGGDDCARLEGLAKQLSAHVEFRGLVSDGERDRLLAECRCFCLPSRGEGFGLVYLEAMQLGKPVLAGNSDAGREIVIDGVTGRTVDPLDSETLRHAILDVCGPNADRMGVEGRRRFETHFTFGAFRRRFAAAIHGTRSRDLTAIDQPMVANVAGSHP